MIMINGQIVASSFTAFRKYCRLNKLKEEEFKNWPFTHHMDGVTPVGASKAVNP